MLFDSPADPRDYPWRTTWFAEHANESTLAFFASDFRDEPVGPGICLGTYAFPSAEWPVIDERELRFSYSRSGGPGGQNVNKLETKATLVFDVDGSPSLTDEQKATIHARLATRITRSGELVKTRDNAAASNHTLVLGVTTPWRDRLGEISVPTLVVHGTEDPILPFPHGQALADEIPGASLYVMEGVGHELPAGEWDGLIEVLLAHTE